MDIVIAENLTKIFPMPDGTDKRAVDGLSFVVPQGQVYGLLGPNGAGKTTTLRVLSGLMAPTSGRVTVGGHDVSADAAAVKRIIGLLTANTGLYHRLNTRELLRYFAALHGMNGQGVTRRVEHLIEWLDMGEFAAVRCGALSTGQRQRANIARALIADPPVLIMDEPTLGLDVLSNRVILDFILRERDEGKTVLLCTHHLDEAESLCNRIGLLHHGRLVAEGTLEELRAQVGEERLSHIFLKVVGADDPRTRGRR